MKSKETIIAEINQLKNDTSKVRFNEISLRIYILNEVFGMSISNLRDEFKANPKAWLARGRKLFNNFFSETD